MATTVYLQSEDENPCGVPAAAAKAVFLFKLIKFLRVN